MKFKECGLIIYPYITNSNQLVYEVDYETGIREVTQILPDLGDSERWECFGVDVDVDTDTSEVTVAIINVY